MTDGKTLLELAAKAAGLPYIKPTPDYDGSLGLQVGSDNPMRCWTWNPCKDIVAAFRLAIKLGINFEVIHPRTRYELGRTIVEKPKITVLHGNNPEEATCEAIVRAAAEIGRNL